MYSVVHGRSAELCTPFGEFIYRAQNLELYALGMDMIFIESYPVLMATKEKAMLDTLAQHALNASKLSGETIFEYVVQNLRIEPSSLTTLSLKKLKPLAFRYRNFGPRKLYAHLEILQNRLTT